MKRILYLIISVIIIATFTSCKDNSSPAVAGISVEKIEGLSREFIMGADISSVIAEENSGVKYYGGSAVDNQALFSFDGKPSESLRTFLYVYYGAVKE